MEQGEREREREMGDRTARITPYTNDDETRSRNAGKEGFHEDEGRRRDEMGNRKTTIQWESAMRKAFLIMFLTRNS